MSAPDASEVLSVAELTEQIKGTLEGTFSRVWVAGEISDLARPRSGHLYFTLKDESSQIRGVMWRSVAQSLPFELEDGHSVLCFGSIDVYAARGSYQMVVRKIQPQGLGALQLAFQQLQMRLAAEGLFDAERKRPLPRFPKRIGFVTSPTGAAAKDFLEVATRRWPGIEILIIPAVVQGPTAAESIRRGIALAHQLREPLDVLVVGRGGGSIEDLWCFNEEPVVRAIAASRIPTISAVGHEIDVTLSDFVADVRALTPSAAAEMVVPDAQEFRALLEQVHQRMKRLVHSRVELNRQRLEALASRTCFTRPLHRIEDSYRKLDEIDLRMSRAVQFTISQKQTLLQKSAATLEAYSPLSTLARGYSITQSSDGQILRNHKQIEVGDSITTQLHEGKLLSRVEQIVPPQ